MLKEYIKIYECLETADNQIDINLKTILIQINDIKKEYKIEKSFRKGALVLIII